MRRFWGVTIIVVLAAAAFGGTWAFLRSPHYALYQIGHAIYQRDPQLFLAYVDVDHIILNQSGDVADLLVPDLKKDNQKSMFRQMVGVVMGALKNQIREKVAQAVADPKRDNLPSSWAILAGANITRKDQYALVVLSDPSKGRRLRMGMRRDEHLGNWRVVNLDAQDVKMLLTEYVADKQKKLQQPKQETPAPAPAPAQPSTTKGG